MTFLDLDHQDLTDTWTTSLESTFKKSGVTWIPRDWNDYHWVRVPLAIITAYFQTHMDNTEYVKFKKVGNEKPTSAGAMTNFYEKEVRRRGKY